VTRLAGLVRPDAKGLGLVDSTEATLVALCAGENVQLDQHLNREKVADWSHLVEAISGHCKNRGCQLKLRSIRHPLIDEGMSFL
jgi:hypothetical protein